ncbi:hypothetical protein ACT6B8_04320 [Campylobacter coli]|uniref:hypothetical protein n=1 Tax=Campylobacter coli TaxID=195 RepID=UPI00025815AF|nr:hypothetical protein [Campylobacter coli]EIB12654.1 hypothetical protein cco93_10681 [Campylobacter coli H8]
MSKEVQEFIDSLKNYKDFYNMSDASVYKYENYNCEASLIYEMQKKNNIKGIIDFWKNKENEKYLEFQHPIYNHIKTRAVGNYFSQDINNIVFFIDKSNQYPWAIFQICSCINYIIVCNKIYLFIEPWKSNTDWCFKPIAKFLSSFSFCYKNIEFGYLLNNYRPFHYFYHQLFPLLDINTQKQCFGENFFKPKKIKKENGLNNKVYITPYIAPYDVVYRNQKDILNIKTSYILQESLSDYSTLVDKDPLREDKVNDNKLIQTLLTNNQNKQDKINNQEQLNNKQPYDLIIWLGLPGERRAWLEQIDGTANILKHFNKYFNKIKVYIDGMTAYDGERKEYPENKALFLKVLNATKELLQKEYNNAPINTNSYNDIYGINSKDYCGARYTLNSDICILDFDELKELKLQSQENTYDNHANALEKLNEIKSKEKLIVFKSLAGYDYRTKICYCNDCDIVISDSGTTALVPFEFHKKPGVVFYGDLSAHWINISKNYASNAYQRVIDEKLVKQTDRKSVLVWNYHIPPQHIYNLAAEVLEELSVAGKLKIKNLKMHRLDVPPVELIAKQYELEQTLKIKLPIESVALYGELEKQINTLVLHNNTTLNQALENINTNNALSSTLQHSLQTKDQTIQNLENKIKDIEFKLYFKTAKARIQNHLAYKLGSALIENSKSIFGYIRMPYVLSYIKDKHRLEQKRYEENIKRYPELTLPPLESYPDYKEALKEKECFTYKLGEALIRADKEWYKGGYIKLWFEIKRIN